MMYRYLAIVLVLLGSQVHAEPLSLSVNQIRKDLAAEVVDIRVIELHESGKDKTNAVTYSGIPLDALLQYLYPKQWKTFDGIIYFHALDGYLSIVDAQKARQGGAYMTFARADGQPFMIDNRNQNERDVPLAPFYLVWDNLKDPDLQQSNSYAWPYQVYSMELVSGEMLQSLLPPGAPPSVEAGFDAYKNNCLSCHNIGGFGGRKFGMDVRQVIKGKSRDDLYDWIDNPSAINKYTAMPPLDPGVTGDNRQRVINQIIDYLQAI
ncbi:MAG: cytochrome c [Gammaproteobacteria bacterium]|jgi:mono/diheme cytochrome c family protein|nr:cytochrome c [Gammaproteobacteria bacterium]